MFNESINENITGEVNCSESKYIIDSKHSVYHHLRNVLRVKDGEEIIVFNGRGIFAHCVLEISPKKITFLIGNFRNYKHDIIINLYISVTKIDSFKKVIQNACECGVLNIYPLETEFSQRYSISLEKLDKIIVGSLEQSNNYLKPILWPIQSIENLNYDKFLNCSNVICNNQGQNSFNKDINNLDYNIFIGPEGGWSSRDLSFTDKIFNLQTLNFPTPILRTYNAVVYGISKLV